MKMAWLLALALVGVTGAWAQGTSGPSTSEQGVASFGPSAYGGSSTYSSSSYGVSSYSSTEYGSCAGGLQREASLNFRESNDDPSIGKQASHYFLSRWYDLCDVVDFSFGAGPGFLVHAQATKFAQAGFGYSDAYRVGFRGRSAGIWREKRLEAGVSLMYWQKIERERVTGWVESFRADKMDLDTATVYLNNADRSYMGVGATIHALILVDVNVRPAQAADFVLGWFGIDILDDDTGKPRRNKDL